MVSKTNMTKIKGILLRTIFTFAALFSLVAARADEAVSFEVNTPLIVTAGEMFRVEFILQNGQIEDNSFKAPDFAGLDVLAGPTVSTSSSVQWINGKTSRTSTYTITYVVVSREKADDYVRISVHTKDLKKNLEA